MRQQEQINGALAAEILKLHKVIAAIREAERTQ
jgi:hypothetical protein